MPVISVDVLPGRSRQQKRALAERITTRFAATCGVDRSTVRVIVREVSAQAHASREAG